MIFIFENDGIQSLSLPFHCASIQLQSTLANCTLVPRKLHIILHPKLQFERQIWVSVGESLANCPANWPTDAVQLARADCNHFPSLQPIVLASWLGHLLSNLTPVWHRVRAFVYRLYIATHIRFLIIALNDTYESFSTYRTHIINAASSCFGSSRSSSRQAEVPSLHACIEASTQQHRCTPSPAASPIIETPLLGDYLLLHSEAVRVHKLVWSSSHFWLSKLVSRLSNSSRLETNH